MSQMVIANVGIMRRIVRIWEGRVNLQLGQGWKVINYSVEKRGLRIVCVALLEKRE